ncbi:MAG: hypothetical protein Q8Q25_00925, partial [bacterium]|nr:hypothetical protein [bacterium]
LDRVAANLLDAKLGNDGHFGLGLFFRTQNQLDMFIRRYWATDIIWSNKISAEYLFPAYEKRFYIEKINPEDFARRDFTDATKANDNLTFLEHEAISRIYLLALSTRVQPGIIFHWTSKVCRQGRHWGWALGSDFWCQSRDHLGSIALNCSPTTSQRIDFQKAKPFSAYRFRLFGGLTYKIERPNHHWFISLNVDGTPFRSGIGRDFSVFFKIERHF